MNKIKFSIIIPVYNTEKYLTRCFNSVLKQTYKNYEVIVINDGSTDDSLKLIKKYKTFKCINQKNKGLSEARNNGINKSTGDYLIFLDSDDYLNHDLLKMLNTKINKEDILRIQLATFNTTNELREYHEAGFSNLNGGEAFSKIMSFNFVENASLYIIKRDYWIKNNFKFKENKIHEDFGIIPEVIFKASNVSCFDFIGNYYYQRTDGIMGSNNYEKELKKAFDVLEQGLEEIHNINIFNKYGDYKKYPLSYIVNSILEKSNNLKLEDRKAYLSEVKNNNLLDYLLSDTIKRKLKKVIYKIKYKL